MSQEAFTSCSDCHTVELPACPSEIILISTAIDADYDYFVILVDKFQNEHITEIKAPYTSASEIHIPIEGNADFMPGLFTEHSGPFTLTLKKTFHDNEENIALEGVSKNCVVINFKKQYGAVQTAGYIGKLTTP